MADPDEVATPSPPEPVVVGDPAALVLRWAVLAAAYAVSRERRRTAVGPPGG